jgi:hypothetical protein
MDPGQAVASPPSFGLADVRPGQTLTLASHAGPVLVQRQVQAVQAGRWGQRFFVRDAEGVVFAAAAQEAQP